MLDFIDISLSTSDQEQPYLIFVFERGTVTSVTRYAQITSVADYCQRHALPVVSSNPTIREALAAFGIAVQPFEVRMVGS